MVILMLLGTLAWAGPVAGSADPAPGVRVPPRLAAPRAVDVLAGTATGTLHSVGARQEYGNADRPPGYLLLDPGTGRSIATFRFRVTGSPRLDLRVVARAAIPELWRVEAWNAGTGSWEQLWRGRNAPAGRWTVRLLSLGSEHQTGRMVRIRLIGRGEPLALDQLTLHRRPGVWRPAPGTTWQWQLNTGNIDTSFDVAMYDVDLFDTPQATINQLRADGRVVVCYFSAGSWENWRSDAGDFPAAVKGSKLDGWAGERWLDVRRLDLLGPIMKDRLDLAARKGCDGVEPDNVDGYTNGTGFPLKGADQLAYNRWLARRAHERGLSVGLKNDLDQIPQLVGRFDWALDEQCFQYRECDTLTPFVIAGKAVFGVEYRGKPETFCPQANLLGFSWMKKNRNLNAWADPCWD